jgi:hypothetical protein
LVWLCRENKQMDTVWELNADGVARDQMSATILFDAA